MGFTRGLIHGIVSAFTLTSPPLYRYPYRNSLEAFRSDWKHIGKDIEASGQPFEGPGAGDQHE
jgi:hypothetical protein